MAESDQDFDDIFSEENAAAQSSGSDLFTDVDASDTSASKAKGRGTAKIGKETFAVGLIWNAATEDGGKPAEQAKQAAKDEAFQAQFFCLRHSSAVQYGLGRKAMGHRNGQRALAAVLADQLSGDWLAAFEVEQDYYIVAHRDDLILSDYDRLLTNGNEAKALFTDLLYSAEWDEVIAPAGWHIDDTQPRPIDALIEKGKDHKLKAISPLSGPLPLLLGGLIVGGVALGGFSMMSGDDYTYVPPDAMGDPFDEAPFERKRGLVEQVEEAVEPVTDLLGGGEEAQMEAETPPPAPWIGRPNGVGLLLACTSDIKAVPLDVPGWNTTSVVCGDNIRLSLSRTGGKTIWAETYFRNRGDTVDFSRSVGSESIAHGYPMSFVSSYEAEFETPEIRDVQRYLGYQFEAFDLELDFTEGNGTTSKIDRYYESASFSFETDLEPAEFAEIFSRLPGVLIDEVSYDLTSKVWDISGRYYHKRDTPIPPPAPEGGFPGEGGASPDEPEY